MARQFSVLKLSEELYYIFPNRAMRYDNADLNSMEEQAIQDRDRINKVAIDFKFFEYRLNMHKLFRKTAHYWTGFLTALRNCDEIIFFLFGDREKKNIFNLEDWKPLKLEDFEGSVLREEHREKLIVVNSVAKSLAENWHQSHRYFGANEDYNIDEDRSPPSISLYVRKSSSVSQCSPGKVPRSPFPDGYYRLFPQTAWSRLRVCAGAEWRFELIRSQSHGPVGEHGMTTLQAEFWRVVWECKDRINSAPKHIQAPVVRQFYLEVEVWGTFWDENTFPGKYPIPVQPQLATTSQAASAYDVRPPVSSINDRESSVARTLAPQSFISQNLLPGSTLTQHPPPKPDVLKPELTVHLRDLARQVIFYKRGHDYVPKHGWDKVTGLPIYSILCFVRNGFLAFSGYQQQYFNIIIAAFSKFCVMFQKIQRGFLIIWLEVKTVEQTVALATNPKLWKAFKECWTFLKSWASQPGDAMNVATYLENYAGDAEAQAEADNLMPPPHPAWL